MPPSGDQMLDRTRDYGEVGWNVYGVKWTQDGKYYRNDGTRVTEKGVLWNDMFMGEDEFNNYEPPMPVSQIPDDIDALRERLDELGISWSPLAKAKTLRKRLEAAE